MEDEVLATRKTSSRRSKPDIAALVDQQRFLCTYKPRCPVLTSGRLYPTVNLCPLPLLPTDDLGTSEDGSSHDASPTHSPVPRKRRARRSDAGVKRVKKSPTRFRNGVQARPSIPNHQYDNEDTHILSSQDTVQNSRLADDYVPTASLDTEIDEDDNLPLSSFIVSRPPAEKIVGASPSPPQQSSPSPPPRPSTPSPSPPPKSMRSPSPSPVLCYCSKPAVLDDPRWDGEFCSPECLISKCHQAFYTAFHSHPMRNRSAVL